MGKGFLWGAGIGILVGGIFGITNDYNGPGVFIIAGGLAFGIIGIVFGGLIGIGQGIDEHQTIDANCEIYKQISPSIMDDAALNWYHSEELRLYLEKYQR